MRGFKEGSGFSNRLVEADSRKIAANGVGLAKAGFGAVKTPFDYVPMMSHGAKEARP